MIDPSEKRLQQLEDTVIKLFAVLQSTGAAVEEVAGTVKVLANELGELTEKSTATPGILLWPQTTSTPYKPTKEIKNRQKPTQTGARPHL